MRCFLLPGMDGTGALFRWFIEAMPEGHRCDVLSYDRSRPQGYVELAAEVRGAVDASDEPVLIVAESFSGPIAVALASDPPSQLRGVVLAASFACCPVSRWLRPLASRWLFAVPPPAWAARRFIVGDDADAEVVEATLQAIRCVRASVMARRVREVLSVDVRAELRGRRVPVHAIHATHDRLVDGRRAFDGVDVPVLGVLAAPHAVLQRCPDASAALVADLASKLEAR